MYRRQANGIRTYQFDSLNGARLVHAVFTRLGGVSQGPFATLNVGNTVGDDEAAVAENHARVYAHLDVDPASVKTPHQVHGNRIVVVEAGNSPVAIPNTDGLLTGTPGVALFLRFADCQPILLYDPVRHVLGLVHAGWRGVALGIAGRAVETMGETFGSQPGDLIAGLGPAIGPCCYTVGQEVAAAMGYALPQWREVMHPLQEGAWRFDLPAANAQQLLAAGVQRIEQAGLCTACHRDEFFSHRGEDGRTGRFAAVAYLCPFDRPEEIKMPERATRPPQQEGPEAPYSINPPGFPGFAGSVEDSP